MEKGMASRISDQDIRGKGRNGGIMSYTLREEVRPRSQNSQIHVRLERGERYILLGSRGKRRTGAIDPRRGS